MAADLERIQARIDGRLIADHRRSWGNALTITAVEHVQAAARLRDAFRTPRTAPAEADVLVRNLADYDTAFGVDIEAAS